MKPVYTIKIWQEDEWWLVRMVGVIVQLPVEGGIP